MGISITDLSPPGKLRAVPYRAAAAKSFLIRASAKTDCSTGGAATCALYTAAIEIRAA
jgi:hypothetical protein